MPPEESSRRPVVVGVTGASGVVYAQRLVRFLLENEFEVLLSISKAGRRVIQEELDLLDGQDPWGASHRSQLRIYPEMDYGAPFCSGSFRFRGMVVIPASMGTVGSIASGVSINNIHRGADVALKERLPLVLVPRETPFSTIHLENLLTLSRAGAVILPPSPAFYQRPKSIDDQIDFVVSRVLDALGIPNDLFRRWKEA
ncbi:MAG TPA: flavin prenyltransferase UbiX [Planctomycetota bacterium]|jgi:4-hydroxy-3-polyprenylbenzoate decarboxylase|nr:flavin prenyltransferase UbiX [Planctomycetota bacterium]